MQLNNNNLSGCYPSNIAFLCPIAINTYISYGNNFNTSWEDFCAKGNSNCNDKVWPGDADNNGTVNFRDLLYWGAANGNTGVLRFNATTNWVGQSCADWSVNVNGVNGKHQDADGNGVVNASDRDVLTQNMGQMHGFVPYDEVASSFQFILNPDLSVNDGSNFAYDFFIDDAGNTVTAHGIQASIFFGGLSVASAMVDVSASSLNP